MKVEYDLIVIGDRLEAIYAASLACSFNARVALVINPSFRDSIAFTSNMTHLVGATLSWKQEVITNILAENSLSHLASLGVDVIIGKGEFCRLPHFAFLVNNRSLRSRAYLIANSLRPLVRPIDELDKLDYLTIEDIFVYDKLDKLPSNILIIGGHPAAIALAQTLKRLNKQVTLVIESPRLLPKEDLQASTLIQGILEADGVKILTDAPVTQVKRINGTKWVQAGNSALEADEIILAPPSLINVDGLNLEGVGVKFNSFSLELNEKMQTTNPRIYSLSNSPFSNISQYEATIAVKNALFFPRFKVDYPSIPRAIFTTPPLARVGLTEAQALKYFGKDVIILCSNYKTISLPQMLGDTTGFCKILIRPNGKIIGAHIVGAQAEELIGAIAIAMKNNLKIDSLTHIFPPSPSFSEIIQNTAQSWHSPNKILRNLFLEWFNWARNF